MQMSFKIYDKVLSPNSLEIADYLINLSILEIHKKNYEKALEIQNRALNIRLQKLNSNHIIIAKSYMSIGGMLVLTQSYELAEECLQ